MNLKELKDLIDLIKNTDISELEIEEEGTKIKLKKKEGLDQKEQLPQAFIQPRITVQKPHEIPEAKPEKETDEKTENVVEIVSPMVGTFYRSSNLDTPPFIQEGDTVVEGQVMCIIEAMKLMNEVKAEFKCKVVKILIDNGHAVEYGQPLFLVEQL